MCTYNMCTSVHLIDGLINLRILHILTSSLKKNISCGIRRLIHPAGIVTDWATKSCLQNTLSGSIVSPDFARSITIQAMHPVPYHQVRENKIIFIDVLFQFIVRVSEIIFVRFFWKVPVAKTFCLFLVAYGNSAEADEALVENLIHKLHPAIFHVRLLIKLQNALRISRSSYCIFLKYLLNRN